MLHHRSRFLTSGHAKFLNTVPTNYLAHNGARPSANTVLTVIEICIPPSFSYFHGFHDDVIKWKHFPRYWPFVRGIHRSPVNSSHKGQWRGAYMFSLICVWVNGWVNNHEAGDLRRYRAHYDVTVMSGRCSLYDVIQDGRWVLPKSHGISRIQEHLTRTGCFVFSDFFL